MTVGKELVAKEGPSVLLTGFGPTAVGYFVQGGAKFAGYEFWKRNFVASVGGYDNAVPYRTAIYMGSAAIAEFFADVLLTPLEATRIRLVSDRTYAKGFVAGFTRMAKEGGLREFYAGFIPILFKQIPFALGQFTVNEWCHEIVNKRISEEQQKNLSGVAKGGITLGCGIVAGIAASLLSQPADTLLSAVNKQRGAKGSIFTRLATLSKEMGVRGLFSGSLPRMVMTATLVSGQFVLYGSIKDALGAKKGIEIHKTA